jgi:hypothetical protein
MHTVSNQHVHHGGDAADNRLPLATMQTIPNELLLNILGFLDVPRTSTLGLIDEPSFKLTDAAVADLKTISLVSKRWRQAILPLLFRHARLIIPSFDKHTPTLHKRIQPLLDFIIQRSLDKTIASFTLVIEDVAVVVGLDHRTSYQLVTFWKSLFDVIDITDLTIVAPVEVLGVLTSCRIYTVDAWSFDCPCHYLRLQRPSINRLALSEAGLSPGPIISDNTSHEANESTALENSDDSKPSPSFLFKIRPWTSLLLNEGSFIKAYSQYEFWLRQTPSVGDIYPYESKC